MGFDMLIATTGVHPQENHQALVTEVKEMTPLREQRKNLFHKFQRNAGFCLTDRIWGIGVFFGPDILAFR